MQWILQDVPIGRNIQNIRMKKNMTQAEVVGQLQLMGSSMSRSTLANIESGRRNIKASDLKALQKLFAVDYEEFFEDKRIKSYLIEQNELKISILISGNNYRKLRSVFRLIAEIYKFSLQLQLTVLWLK